MIIDADDALEIPEGFQMPELTADAYVLDIHDTAINYQRTQIVRNTLPWHYRGVLHEFLTCEGSGPSGHLAIVMRRNHDGARRRDPKTYYRDAEVLEQALATETDPFLISRYTFYLAQSCRDCGEQEKALEYYLARAELAYWQDEVFVSLLQAARMKEALGHPEQDVIDAYVRAANALPTRAEAWHGASRYCRLKNRFQEGYEFADRGLKIAYPDGGLFVETWVYEYGLLDELAVNGYWSGHYQECLDASERLLASGKFPPNQRQRVAANANFARQKIADSAVAAATVARAGEHLSQRPKIAVYTIALNEAQHVERWYKSVVDADYLVVADTGSTDDTVQRLRVAGVQVHQIVVRPWRFDDARNASLSLVPADVDICISLDMDEFMFQGWRAKLEAAWTPGTTRLFYNFARGMDEGGSPTKVFRKGKIYSRWGYRWKRIVHEDLHRTEPHESCVGIDAALIGQRQGITKDRGRYLPLMEQAHQEDPLDAQICFWLAREYMYVGQNEPAVEKLLSYLSIPDWDWKDERAEAMRFLARVQSVNALEWLQKSLIEAEHRRELWLDLAEYHHSKLDWFNLFTTCTIGMAKSRRTGSYLDDPDAWGYRLDDLSALACSHLGLIHHAIKYGTAALELRPMDQRLANNLVYYKSQDANKNINDEHEWIRRNSDLDKAWLCSSEKAKVRDDVATGVPIFDLPVGDYTVSAWVPDRAQGGTELMVDGLRSRLGESLNAIDLRINAFGPTELSGKPLVLWMHHNIDQSFVQWCRDTSFVSLVCTFVFVSDWQMRRYIEAFGIPSHKCVVLKNATTIDRPLRPWKPGPVRRVAYASTPFRGLDVLLDAWDRLKPANAELHIWSSRKLYGKSEDDAPYEALFARASGMPNVFYRGIVPNEQLREELRSIDYMAYPSTFEETSCLSVIEAMAAGCRVICPELGALPETTAGFARLYPLPPDRDAHVGAFVEVLADELAEPWQGQVNLGGDQQAYCRASYDWAARTDEWQRLIADLRDSVSDDINGRLSDSACVPAVARNETPTVYAMISTKKSLFYTKKAFNSFLPIRFYVQLIDFC